MRWLQGAQQQARAGFSQEGLQGEAQRVAGDATGHSWEPQPEFGWQGVCWCWGAGWRSLNKHSRIFFFSFFSNIFTVLRNNSHALQFIHLKYIIQWFLVCSLSYITITSNSRTSHYPKKQPHPHQQSPLAPPQPLTPQVHFLSLWMCLFRSYHMNGITHCVAFLSGFSH